MWLKMKNVNIMGFRQFLGENWGAVGGGGGGGGGGGHKEQYIWGIV